jgi:diphosphomevalonate decarboxylase
MTARLLVRAPSNIALIKYMGKSDSSANLPENPSLSMTLESLATWVSAEAGTRGSGYRLVPEVPRGAPARAEVPALSEAGRDKVLRHCERVRAECERLWPELGLGFAPARDLELRSANTFPQASGIASSASSFAAITLAVAASCAADRAAFCRALESGTLRQRLASLSRQGSGSSCRSFEGPWVRWEGAEARALDAPALPELAHFVLLISAASKEVSSSEAHARVKSSPLWAGRTERVARRLSLLERGLAGADLASIARLAWSEAWEMHSLFHTAAEPFSYWKPGTIEALHWLAPYVSGASAEAETPPIVTMDAGPNIHVTVRRADAPLWRERLRARLGDDALLEDRPGRGAEVSA